MAGCWVLVFSLLFSEAPVTLVEAPTSPGVLEGAGCVCVWYEPREDPALLHPALAEVN